MTGRDIILTEIIETVKENDYNGILIVPTGGGKSRAMIEIAKELKPQNILYLCDNTELRDKTFKDELYKWDASYLIPYIDFACYQTACKWKDKHYDLLLADEFDFSLTPKYSQVYFNNTFDKKILVSATLDYDKRNLSKKIAPIIYERKQQNLIDDNVLNKIQPFIINYDLLPNENKKYLEYNNTFSKILSNKDNRSSIEFLKIRRKQFLSSLNSSVKVTKWLISTLSEKTLIFSGLSSQADKIHYNTYHSINNNKDAFELFNSGKENVLVVVEKITRGVNTEGIRNVIHESPGRSKTKLIQKTGRGMRLGVDETLNVFYLIPYFNHPLQGKRPTIVKNWVDLATEDLDMSKAKIIEYKI